MTSCIVKYTYDRPWPEEMMRYVMPFVMLLVSVGLVAYLGLMLANEWKRRGTLTEAQELLRKHKTDTE